MFRQNERVLTDASHSHPLPLQLGWTDMQMCLNDGQEKSYSSAQLLSSASGVVYLLLGGAMAFVWFAPVMEDEVFNKPTQYMSQQSGVGEALGMCKSMTGTCDSSIQIAVCK